MAWDAWIDKLGIPALIGMFLLMLTNFASDSKNRRTQKRLSLLNHRARLKKHINLININIPILTSFIEELKTFTINLVPISPLPTLYDTQHELSDERLSQDMFAYLLRTELNNQNISVLIAYVGGCHNRGNRPTPESTYTQLETGAQKIVESFHEGLQVCVQLYAEVHVLCEHEKKWLSLGKKPKNYDALVLKAKARIEAQIKEGKWTED